MRVIITLDDEEAEQFMTANESWGTRIIADVSDGHEWLSIQLDSEQIRVERDEQPSHHPHL